MAKTDAPTTLALVGVAAGYFGEKGVESPRLEAEVLLAHVLKVDRVGLYLQFDKPLTPEEISRYRELVRRRAGGEPTAYLIGSREFWSLSFAVSPAVLIPRPDTELLVETALSLPGDALQIAELGVGSGAPIISILSERKNWLGCATDISGEALEIAALNAKTHGVGDRLSLFNGDLFAPLAGRRFDLIITNPPYIPTGVIRTLAREVAAFEPHLALDGGTDGLDLIRRIVAETPGYLKPGGHLLFEFGAGQEGAIQSMLENSGGFVEIRILDDLARTPRAALLKIEGRA